MQRIKHLIRWEFLALFLTVILVFNFAYEPNQRALIESLFETHYENLHQFYQVYQAVETKSRLSSRDSLYARHVLSNLIAMNFILKPEAYHTLGKLYEREKSYTAAMLAYQAMLSIAGSENFLKRDALWGMGRVLLKKNQYRQAKEYLEKAWALPTKYRQLEVAFALLDVYDMTGEREKQKQILLSLDTVSFSYRDTYRGFLQRFWRFFSPEEQRQLLEKNFSPSMATLLLEEGKLYISQQKPSLEWVEKWALFLAAISDDTLVQPLEKFLKQYKEYASVVEELSAYRYLATTFIPYGSSSAQAAYVYRGLRTLSRRANYQPVKAEKYYETFFHRGFVPEYVSKNLELLIRNFLAYKQYDKIVEWIAKTYEKMGIAETTTEISEGVSFWYGYSAWQRGQKDLAIQEWMRTIAIAPQSYYGSLAMGFLRNILTSEDMKSLMKEVEEKRNKSKNRQLRLFYGKVLYGLAKNGAEKEKYREQVADELVKLYPELFGASLQEIEKLPLEKYFRWLVYSRFGFTDYAREILYEAGVHNETVAKIALLKMLVYYKNFSQARQLFHEIENHPLVKNHVGFFSQDIRKVLYPLPYMPEVRIALSMQTNQICDPYLVHAVIKGESLFYPAAKSRVGARGLMQLMPATARLIIPSVFESKDVSLYDPANNIVLGTSFLSWSVNTYGLLQAIAVYNGGPRVVEKTKKQFQPDDDVVLVEILPYTETRLYVRKVMGYYHNYLDTYENATLPVKVSESLRLLTRK